MLNLECWMFSSLPAHPMNVSPTIQSDSHHPLHPMKLKSLLLLVLATALTFAAPRRAQARGEASFEFFYESLAPHGEWIEVGDYGSCWRPRGVDADWSPYSDGYWSYTDGGWTWVSYEEFGGIVYHYGRWVQVEDEGWCWVPDYQWAPAWVSWRSSDDYVGWAPLPPEARWRRETGISVWADAHYDIGPSRYNFCRVHDFGDPYLRPVIVNRFENFGIVQHTVNVTNISYYDGGGYGGLVHCGGPSFVVVNRFVNRPIPALKLVQKTNITNINIKQVNVFNSVQRGNQLTVLAPRVAAPTAALVRPHPARTIAAAKVTKGWAGVKDPETATAIRTQLRQESKGLTPETAPARRVADADLKVLPKKADPNAPSPVKTAKQRLAPATPQPGNALVPNEKTVVGNDKPEVVKPVDPRIVDKKAREKAREDAGDKPAVVTTPETAEPKKLDAARKRAITTIPENTAPVAPNSKERKAPRTIAPATVNPPATEKKFTAEPVERAPMVKPKTPSNDAAEKARESALRQRALAEQKERAAVLERPRAVPETVKKPKDDGAEMQRRLQLDQARRQQSVEAARKEQAVQNARQLQIESARRQKAVEIQREPQVQRQAPVMKQQAPVIQRQAPVIQRQAPVMKQQAPVMKQQAPQPSNGKRKLTPEEIAELQKKQGR